MKTVASCRGGEGGRFSLVFEGKAGDSRLLFLDHEKRECVDVGNEPEETAEEERDRIDNEVDVMMEEGPTKRKYRADDVNSKPVKAWLGGNKKEKVGEWNTEVYEASGKMAKRKVTRNGAYKVNGTFSEYSLRRLRSRYASRSAGEQPRRGRVGRVGRC